MGQWNGRGSMLLECRPANALSGNTLIIANVKLNMDLVSSEFSRHNKACRS